jgi:hypothetical protein
MIKFVKSFFLLCGVSLALAALPVFAQQDANGITINKKPLRDFSESVKDKIAKKEVDLDKPFLVELEGVLIEGGKFDSTKSKFIRSEGDAKVVEIAKQAMLVIGDSGWFGYLKAMGIKKIIFTLSQNDTELTAKILGEQKDENTAKTTASGLNTFILIGQKTADGDEKVLLDKATVTPEGKMIVLNFAIPKQVAQEMITRKLQENERKETIPNSK